MIFLWIGRILFVTANLLLIFFLSHWSLNSPISSQKGLLRFSWKMTNGWAKVCEKPLPMSQKRTALHMRPQKFCRQYKIPYQLDVSIDGKSKIHQTLEQPRTDLPLYIDQEISLKPGVYDLDVVFAPKKESLIQPQRLKTTIKVLPGRILLIQLTESGFELTQ